MTAAVLLPAHISSAGHELTLLVAALVICGVGVVTLGAAFLERTGRLDATTPSVPFDSWSAVIAAGWSVGAAAIHFAVIGEHFEIQPVEGVFFIAVAWFQVGWAGWFAARPLPRVALVGALVNATVVAIWIWSRAVGMPIGGHGGATEAIAVNDAIATAFEVALVGTVIVGWYVRGRPVGEVLRLPPATAAAWTASALVVAVVLASVGIVQGSSHDHATGTSDDGHALPGAAGSVTFGSQLDPAGGIVDASDTLSAAEAVAWVAVFSGPVGSNEVQLVVLTLDETGAETEQAREDVFLARSDTQSLTEVRDLAGLGGGPGTYRVRYLAGDTVLAEGDVTLVP